MLSRILPMIERRSAFKNLFSSGAFWGDAAFGNPEMYEYLEAESVGYAIRVASNRVLQERIGIAQAPPSGDCRARIR